MNDYGDSSSLVVPGSLRGYRCWRLDKNKLELYPLHVNLGAWTEGKLQARCSGGYRAQSHGVGYPAPQSRCCCGIYATYRCKDYRDQLPNFWSYYPGLATGIVHGSIKATGRIILGEIGFRAERAEIEALWGLGACTIARIYELPWFLTKRKFLKHFPPHDVSGLLEENPNDHDGTVQQQR